MRNHIVCIASYFKGNEFYEECHERGWRVTLVTHEKLLDEAWAWTSLSAVKTVRGEAAQKDYIRTVANIAGTEPIDKIVGIDEFDVLTAAKAREHLQVEGLSSSYLLRFRDKLRMRKTASAANLPCPEFIGAFNSKEIQNFLETVPAPWIIKPRTEVNAFGIKKCETAEQVWQTLNDFDARHTWRDHPSQFLIERFIEGKVFHVDSVVVNGRVVACGVSEYGQPPLKVSHQGGVFTTSIVAYKSKERWELEKLNKQLLKSFEYEQGVAHAEFLQSQQNGKFYLLEVAARVGGAFIADVLEHASGLNLWREWARLEIATKENPYNPPRLRTDYAAIALCLANSDAPDTSHYTDKEIVHRVSKPRHAGLIFHAETRERINELLEIYTEKMARDFLAIVPIKERHDA